MHPGRAQQNSESSISTLHIKYALESQANKKFQLGDRLEKHVPHSNNRDKTSRGCREMKEKTPSEEERLKSTLSYMKARERPCTKMTANLELAAAKRQSHKVSTLVVIVNM